MPNPATLDWEAHLIDVSSKTPVRQSALERQQNRENMRLLDVLDFDALDFSAVVANTQESDDDL